MSTPRRRVRDSHQASSAARSKPSGEPRARLRRPRLAWLGVCAAAVGLAVAALSLPRLVGGETDRAAGSGAHKPRTTELAVPGPAAGIAGADVPNRVGSAAVPVRLYEPAGEVWGTLVWAHGGSFVLGTLDWPEADWVSQRFAEAGLRVYSVDYLLASDTVKAPAPGADVAAVLRWVAEQEGAANGPLIVGGASAGAHLATLAAFAQAELAGAEGARAADALILEYPTLHRVQRASAEIAAATAELPAQRRFPPERIAEMYDFYLGLETAPETTEAQREAAASPVRIAGEASPEQLALLPPTVIVNADADDLRASGEEFAEQLRGAGVAVTERVEAGTVHGYLNRPDESVWARKTAQATIDFFVSQLRGMRSDQGV